MANKKASKLSSESQPESVVGLTDEDSKPKTIAPPVRLVQCTLDKPYDGWKFTGNRNFTLGELDSMTGGLYFRTRDTLKSLVTEWEGFVDRDGAPIAFGEWDKVVVDVIIAMGYKLAGISVTVPKE